MVDRLPIVSAPALAWWFTKPASVASLAPFAPDGFIRAIERPGYLPLRFPSSARHQMAACMRRLVEPLGELADGRPDAVAEVLRIMQQLEEVRSAEAYRMVPGAQRGDTFHLRERQPGFTWDALGFPRKDDRPGRVVVPFPDRSP